MERITFGIIAGSGFAGPDGLLEDAVRREVETPYGTPSPVFVGRVAGTSLWAGVVVRHGLHHELSPTDVPYEANMYALAALAEGDLLGIIGITAVGILRPDKGMPGDLFIPKQYIDRTRFRRGTFFGRGDAKVTVGHIQFADPVCPSLAGLVCAAARGLDYTVHEGGTEFVMEGPQFSSRAESDVARAEGADIIGMTAQPEAKLAREGEVCFATLALATDYDNCAPVGEPEVSADQVAACMAANVAKAREVARHVATTLAQETGLPPACLCRTALTGAIMTDEVAWPDEFRQSPLFRRFHERRAANCVR